MVYFLLVLLFPNKNNVIKLINYGLVSFTFLIHEHRISPFPDLGLQPLVAGVCI